MELRLELTARGIGRLAAALVGATIVSCLLANLSGLATVGLIHLSSFTGTATVFTLLAPLGGIVAMLLRPLARWAPHPILGALASASIVGGAARAALPSDSDLAPTTTVMLLGFWSGVAVAALGGFAVSMLGRRAPFARRATAMLLALALIGAAPPLVDQYREVWLGFDGETVAVFRGPLGVKALVAQRSQVVRDMVPVEFRVFVQEGILVADEHDGSRLAQLLPTIYDRPDLPNGYETFGGKLVPTHTCLLYGHEPIDCAARHQWQYYAVVRAPFDRYPGDRILIGYTRVLCAKHLNKVSGTLGPVATDQPIDGGGWGADFGAYYAWWQSLRWNDGHRAIACALEGGRGQWQIRGLLPNATLLYTLSGVDDNYSYISWPSYRKAAPDITGTTTSKGEIRPYRDMPFPAANVTLSITAAAYLRPTTDSPSAPGLYGLACRYNVPSNSMYLFGVAYTGRYAIHRLSQGTWTTLGKGDIREPLGDLEHRLIVTCANNDKGIRLTLKVDDQTLPSVTDPDPLPGGTIAIYLDEHVHFNSSEISLS